MAPKRRKASKFQKLENSLSLTVANFNNQPALRFQMRRRRCKNSPIGVQAIAPGRKRDMRIKITHIRLKRDHFFSANIRRVGHDQIEGSLDCVEPVTLQKLNAVSPPKTGRILARNSQRSGADCEGGTQPSRA